MKNMKKLLAVFVMAVMALTSTANAAIILDAGAFKITGDAYLDVTQTDTRGIGRVATITDGSTVVWDSGDSGQFLNFTFDEFTSIDDGAANALGVISFTATGGVVNFWLSDFDNFDLTVDYNTALNVLNLGELWLLGTANGATAGQKSATSYSSNGFLDVTGGTQATVFDTDSKTTFLGDTTDLSFNITGTVLSNHPSIHSTYKYSTSGDIQGAVATVPAPAPLFLMGTSLIGLIAAKRKK